MSVGAHLAAHLAAQVVGDQGPWVVWLHGFLGRGDDWSLLVALLPGYRHVLIDLPGHGASTGSLALADDTEAFDVVCDALYTCVADYHYQLHTPSPVYLVGYSLGARLAMALVASAGSPERHRPDRHNADPHYPWAGVILISGHPGITDPVERAQRLAVDSQRAASLRAGLPAFVADWYALPLLRSLHTLAHADQIIARRSVGDADALARTLVALSTGHQPPRLPSLRALGPKLLWLAGMNDQRYTALLTRANAEIPGSKLVLVEDAGHHCHLEQPATVATVIRQHLECCGHAIKQ